MTCACFQFALLESSVKVVRHNRRKRLWKSSARIWDHCTKLFTLELHGRLMADLIEGESAMSPEVSDLLKRALALPVDERAALANTLLDSLDTADRSVANQSVGNQSVEEAWDEEVARRIEDLKAGRAVTVPWEKLHRELLVMVGEK
jgi:putative addiction module component (TIGR02574 family)